MRLVTIVGARPQFIKVAPVSRAISEVGIDQVLIHTGQHFDADMSDVFFEELGIEKPDYHLDINGGGHGAMTGAMLEKLEPLLETLKPDRVLVYGDTNSTLAGALAAIKLHIPVAHVEAGLRSFNRLMPEEINRIVVDQISDLLFSSTDTATFNLKQEGVDESRIFQVGDVMYDAALQFSDLAKQKGTLTRFRVEPHRYVLATIHRAENTDDSARLRNIVTALEEVAESLPVILPLHPRTAGRLKTSGLAFSKVRLIPPLGYLDMVSLGSHAAAIATDSGGVQKEAFFYQVPCVTFRDETEWVELIDLGWNRLAPPSDGGLAQSVLEAIGSKGASGKPYGDGRSAAAIAHTLAAS